MHIPDNYLSPSTCAVISAVMVPVWAVAAKKVKKEITKTRMPLLGIGAAFTFLIMLFNIPVPGGTTVHAIGGTLLAILLGPWSACISITIALLIQALLFGDGGVIAFAVNCFNMAVVMPFSGYFIYKFIKERAKTQKGEYLGILSGSYIGINLAALFAAFELGIQPLLFKNASGQPLYCPYPLSITVPAMTIPNLLIAGVIEAIFTAAVFMFIKRVSPGMIYEGAKRKIKSFYGILFVLVCLSPLGLIAAGTAWGEWDVDKIGSITAGGDRLGYIPEGMKNGFGFSSLFPEYAIKGLPAVIGYIISALAGVAILLIIFKIIAGIRKK
jgi:cobalt/nickel transport system permease protein